MNVLTFSFSPNETNISTRWNSETGSQHTLVVDEIITPGGIVRAEIRCTWLKQLHW